MPTFTIPQDADWLSAQARLQQGRAFPPGSVEGLPPETLSVPPSALGQFGSDVLARFLQDIPGLGALFAPPVHRPSPQEGALAVPFGSPGDPVSQAAFLLAPHLARGMGALGRAAWQPIQDLRDLHRLAGSLGPAQPIPQVPPPLPPPPTFGQLPLAERQARLAEHARLGSLLETAPDMRTAFALRQQQEAIMLRPEPTWDPGTTGIAGHAPPPGGWRAPEPPAAPQPASALEDFQRLLRQRQAQRIQAGHSPMQTQGPAPGGLQAGRQMAQEEAAMRAKEAATQQWLNQPPQPGSPEFLQQLAARLDAKGGLTPYEATMRARLRQQGY